MQQQEYNTTSTRVFNVSLKDKEAWDINIQDVNYLININVQEPQKDGDDVNVTVSQRDDTVIKENNVVELLNLDTIAS